MDLRIITDSQKPEYNKLATHILQSFEWGEFRKELGLPLQRYGIFEDSKLIKAFQITFHKVPLTKSFVGYLPKGPLPDKQLEEALTQIAKEHSCAFIKLEPNIELTSILHTPYSIPKEFKPSPKPLFTKYNFVLDLTKSEEELLKNMHQKTRYNIRVAEKKGVKVEERTDDEAFETYLKLYFETTLRQNYFGHNKHYHKLVWQTLKKAGMARLLIASYNKVPLTAWMLLNFKDTLYYPYGGSSTLHRDVMSSNLIAWEAIKVGKKLNLKEFDLWGALGPDADPKNPWFGFHRFKQGYGARLVEYIGTFDLILNYPLYKSFTAVDKFTKLKVLLLKLLAN